MAQPKVNTLVELREICMDFTNPLEIFREAIQNSYDANANEIWITVLEEETGGKRRVKIVIEDDGDGIPEDKIHCFFDLGESTKSDLNTGKKFPHTVGYKGHGTKIYYNSEGVILETWYEDKYIKVEMENPRAKLFTGKIPEYSDPIEIEKGEKGYVAKEHSKHGTKITIMGYQPNVANPTVHLPHVNIKDYILWFSKHGTIETTLYGQKKYTSKVVFLRSFDTNRIKQGLTIGNEQYVIDNDNRYEKIPFGHIFAEECYKPDDLKRTQLDIKTKTGREVKKPDLLCRKVYASVNETGKDRPDIPFQMVFFIEGDEAKRLYNKMLSPKGRYKIHDDQYTVESRYGLWACKDFIPIINITSWIETKGIKTRFHAFINCDKFELTANRSSIDNTSSDVIYALKQGARAIYREIIQTSEEYKEIEKLLEEEEKQRLLDEDRKEFDKRRKKLSKIKTCKYNDRVLFEPKTEAEVYGLLMTLMVLEPELFDFEILDYRTDKGIDFLVRKKEEKNVPTELADLKYVELKHILSGSFNHAFEFLNKIICYKTGIRNNEQVIGIDGARTFRVFKEGNETKYYLVPEKPSPIKNRIEVIVLETLLKEKRKLEFI